eukprot:6176698-Pleurochrysis_carterae.AAC.1
MPVRKFLGYELSELDCEQPTKENSDSTDINGCYSANNAAPEQFERPELLCQPCFCPHINVTRTSISRGDTAAAARGEAGLRDTAARILPKKIVDAVTNRLKMREGIFVYQSAALHLSNFPRAAAEQLFPPSLLSSKTDKAMTWSLDTTSKVESFMGNLLAVPHHLVAGVSRALQKPSEL